MLRTVPSVFTRPTDRSTTAGTSWSSPSLDKHAFIVIICVLSRIIEPFIERNAHMKTSPPLHIPAHSSLHFAFRIARNTVLVAFVLLAWQPTSTAQDQDRWHCRAQQLLNDGSPSIKPLFAAVTDRFNATDLGYDGDIGLTTFSLTGSIERSDLEALLAFKAIGLAGLQCTSNSGGTITVGTEPYPFHYDTGDAVVDDAQYQTAKSTWIERNPARYAQMNAKDDAAK